MSAPLKTSRYELIAVAVAMLVGVALRVNNLSQVGIEHFDEGVYSSNIWFAGTPDGHYPMRHLYAPPLLPAAIEWCQVFPGPTSLASILPSLITGCLTIFVVWWVLRKWYGPDAALVGVWLAALSDFHITYSRMALTDVPMGFFLVVAVGFGVEAILHGGFARIVLAGVATGLAWWTKYNGWLPLAILSSGTVAWLVIHRPGSVSRTRAFLRWSMIAVVSAVVWLPVVFGLQDKGGYAAVATNHRGYLNPLNEWGTALFQQVRNHQLLESWLTWISLPVAMLAIGSLYLFDSRFTWKLPGGGTKPVVFRLTCGILILCSIGLTLGTSPTLAVLALGGLMGSLIWPIQLSDDSVTTWASGIEPVDRRQLTTWIITAWLVGMFVATPAYRPYPRLSLPLLIAVWLGAAVALAWWVRATRNVARRSTKPGSYLAIGITLFVGLSFIANLALGSRVFGRRNSATGSADRYPDIVLQIEQKLGDSKFIAFTFGEPALMHFLNASGHPAAPTMSLVSQPTPGYEQLVVVGDQARRSADFESQWAKNSHRLESIAVARFQTSNVVALNDEKTAEMLWDYRKPHGKAPPPETFIEVFRVVFE